MAASRSRMSWEAKAALESDDIRLHQAAFLWSIGFGRGERTFKRFLRRIPEVPAHLKEEDKEFPYKLLVDPKYGTPRRCACYGVDFAYERKDQKVDSPTDPADPFWCLFGMWDGGNTLEKPTYSPHGARQYVESLHPRGIWCTVPTALAALGIKDLLKPGELLEIPGSLSPRFGSDDIYVSQGMGGPSLHLIDGFAQGRGRCFVGRILL